MSFRRHSLTIAAFVIFVIAPPFALLAQAAPQAQSTVTADTTKDTSASIALWTLHLEAACQIGLNVMPMEIAGDTFSISQFRLEPALRLYYYLEEPWYLGHGLGYAASFDSDMSKGLGRPGSGTFFIDLAFGYLPRPRVDSDATLGIELRQSAHFGTINDTQLHTFWLRTTLRPRLRLAGVHFELSLPLSLSWRNDPGTVFEAALEIGLVL